MTAAVRGTVYVGRHRPPYGKPGDLWFTTRRKPQPGKPYAVVTICHVWRDNDWHEVEPPRGAAL